MRMLLAAALVAAALLVPTVSNASVPQLELPVAAPLVAALLLAALLAAVPDGPRSRLALVAGVLLGAGTVLKLVDLGCFAVLGQPFDLLGDWALFGNGFDYIRSTSGAVAAIAAVTVAGVVALAVPVLLGWAVRRLARSVGSPARAGLVGVAVLALTLPLLVSGPGPAGTVAGRIRDLHDGLTDRPRFAAELAADPYARTPGAELLTGLRGKDVLLVFVESYGRSAVQDPRLRGPITDVLDRGTKRLATAGFRARSGFLGSGTVGGSSWLAHGSLLAGAWVDSQQRYRQLLESDRLTLNRAFGRAGWRTVGMAPGTTGDWPEGAFYGFDRFYDARTVGYRGPNFSWATMPDQYTLSAYQRLEHGRPDRPPLMAEIQLVSSHAPWTPVPVLLDWDQVGDGAVFGPMAADTDEPASAILTRDPARVRADYVAAVGYALSSVISFVERYGDDDLVLIVLGDHQPNPIVTGGAAGNEVPISVLAKDPAVLERIESWGWSSGLRPRPDAPSWRMDGFRDRFLAAYGSTRTPR